MSRASFSQSANRIRATGSVNIQRIMLRSAGGIAPKSAYHSVAAWFHAMRSALRLSA
jgi:hypothetical protein